jgi:nitrate reductase NapE component
MILKYFALLSCIEGRQFPTLLLEAVKTGATKDLYSSHIREKFFTAYVAAEAAKHAADDIDADSEAKPFSNGLKKAAEAREAAIAARSLGHGYVANVGIYEARSALIDAAALADDGANMVDEAIAKAGTRKSSASTQTVLVVFVVLLSVAVLGLSGYLVWLRYRNVIPASVV